jgi:tetratricopeptide (TPR) repeat protein
MSGCVTVGRYELLLGDPAGTELLPVAAQNTSHPLAQAIAEARRATQQQQPPPIRDSSLQRAVEAADEVTSKAERAVKLFTELAQHSTDAASISDEVDALVDLLQRLDHDERWDDALRLARSLAMLLALLERWIDLVQSLQVALGAAEQLGDLAGKAWALHEQGTLQLAADKYPEAERLLSEARDIRAHDGNALAGTDHNLQLLRKMPAPKPIQLTVLSALLLGALLAIVGGVAGAVIQGSASHPAATQTTTITTTATSTATAPASTTTSTATTTATTTATATTAATTTITVTTTSEPSTEKPR